jgi:hypothetical protein
MSNAVLILEALDESSILHVQYAPLICFDFTSYMDQSTIEYADQAGNMENEQEKTPERLESQKLTFF